MIDSSTAQTQVDTALVISTFKNRQDNHPKEFQTTWHALIKTLTRHLRIADKHAARLWSPARFERGKVRGKDHVIDVSVLAFDIDDGTDASTLEYWLGDRAYVITSSFSHTEAHAKLRVVIRLVAPIPLADFDETWRSANQHLMHGHVDPATKDASRMFYRPSCPPSAQPVAIVHDGHVLDWRTLPALPPTRPVPKHTPGVPAGSSDQEARSAALLNKWDNDLSVMPAASGRHNRLLELARAAGGLVAAGLLNRADVEDVLLGASAANGLLQDDGEASVRRTIHDGLDHGEATPWTPDDLPDSPNWHPSSPRIHLGGSYVNGTPSASAGGTSPVDPPAPLQAEAFLGLAGRIVNAIEPHTEADPVAILLQLLVMFGNACGRKPDFVVEATRHGMNEFVALVGQTSKSRKGTSEAHVRRLFRQADEDWARTHIQTGLSSGEGLIAAVRDPQEKTEAIKDKGRHTGEYQTVVTDSGVEDKRLLLVESEFARTLRVLNREHSTLSAIMRDAWDGRDLSVITRTPVRATEPHISVIGHITRDELRRELTTTDAANGFGNRFMWHAVQRQRVLPFGGELLEATLFADLCNELSAAITFAKTVTVIPMTSVARQVWSDIYPDLSQGRPGLLGAMLARAEAHVRRYAALYTLLDLKQETDAAHLLAALAVWEHAEASARWVFGDALGDRAADAILDALRRRGEMSRTDISDLFAHHESAARISAALLALEEASLAWCEKRSGRGAPQEVWHAR